MLLLPVPRQPLQLLLSPSLRPSLMRPWLPQAEALLLARRLFQLPLLVSLLLLPCAVTKHDTSRRTGRLLPVGADELQYHLKDDDEH